MPKQKTTGDSDNRAGKRYGCLLYSLCFLAMLVLAVGLPYFIWYADAQSELDSEIARIKARGEPLWFSELAPQDSDPDQDATPLFLMAHSKMQWTSQAFSDLVMADPPTPPGDYPVLVTELKANEPALALLSQAVRRPHFRFPFDYETTQPFSLTLEPVQNTREFHRMLRGVVLQSLGTGDQPRAVEAVNEMFDLSELFRDEPSMITQLVRIAIAVVGQNSLKQVVAYSDLTQEQFAELDDRLAKMERQFTLLPALQGERATAFTTMSYLPENIDILKRSQPDDARNLRTMDYRVLRPKLLADEAFMLRTLTDFADFVDKTGPEGRAAVEKYRASLAEASDRHTVSKLVMPAMEMVRQAGLRYRQKMITARLGMRVDRYFSEHGKFPASLDEVLDDKMKTVPADLYTDRPLVYKLLPDGFTTYSVGDDGIDNGGGVKPDHLEGYSGFEVHYPQLATPAETSNDSPNP